MALSWLRPVAGSSVGRRPAHAGELRHQREEGAGRSRRRRNAFPDSTASMKARSSGGSRNCQTARRGPLLRSCAGIPAPMRMRERDDGKSTGRTLVVTRLNPGGVCHVGYVDARTPGANEAARKLADEKARGFKCGTGRSEQVDGKPDAQPCTRQPCQAKATLSSTLVPKRSEERATARPPIAR